MGSLKLEERADIDWLELSEGRTGEGDSEMGSLELEDALGAIDWLGLSEGSRREGSMLVLEDGISEGAPLGRSSDLT